VAELLGGGLRPELAREHRRDGLPVAARRNTQSASPLFWGVAGRFVVVDDVVRVLGSLTAAEGMCAFASALQ
jgi:hypothetical protein